MWSAADRMDLSSRHGADVIIAVGKDGPLMVTKNRDGFFGIIT